MPCVALSDIVNNEMILKTKYFSKWARKTGLTDALLKNAVLEIKCGLLDANLGGGIVKKRIALPSVPRRYAPGIVPLTLRAALNLLSASVTKNAGR